MKIVDPKTLQKYNVKSKQGKILKQYLKTYQTTGGMNYNERMYLEQN